MCIVMRIQRAIVYYNLFWTLLGSHDIKSIELLRVEWFRISLSWDLH